MRMMANKPIATYGSQVGNSSLQKSMPRVYQNYSSNMAGASGVRRVNDSSINYSTTGGFASNYPNY
jgi:hypothetical protein